MSADGRKNCDHSCHGITIVNMEIHCSTHRKQLVYCALCRQERCLECHPYQSAREIVASGSEGGTA